MHRSWSLNGVSYLTVFGVKSVKCGDLLMCGIQGIMHGEHINAYTSVVGAVSFKCKPARQVDLGVRAVRVSSPVK